MDRRAPYIMPDGRPLGQFLQDTQVDQPQSARKNSQTTRRERKGERLGGWTRKSIYQNIDLDQDRDTEAEERTAKLGKDRRRRYLNDKILREMAGAMTAADMEALFQPIPFGETGYESPLTQVTAPDISPIWDLFRNINEDRQARTLQAWEAHLQSQHKRKRPDSQDQETSRPSLSGFHALQSWSKLPRKSREALKRSNASYVEELELPVMEYMDRRASGAESEEAELSLEAENGHQRLLIHTIAAFHNLPSRTVNDNLILLHGKDLKGRGSPDISCADIVFALSANPAGGLNARVLNAQWRKMHLGSDADSEASFVML